MKRPETAATQTQKQIYLYSRQSTNCRPLKLNRYLQMINRLCRANGVTFNSL